MKAVSSVCLVAVLLVLGHPRLTATEVAKLRFVTAVYADEKAGPLSLPEGVACGASGHVVVGDTGNDRLLRFTFQDRAMTGGTEIKIPQLSSPSRVQLNSKGDIYALDSHHRRIVHLGPDGAFRGVLAFGAAPPPATVVPKALAVDGADNIYVLDVFSARVLVLGAEGQFRRALTIPGDAGFVSELAVDSAGNVILLDSIGRRLFSAPKDAGSFAPLGGDLIEFLPTIPASLTASKGVIFVAEGSGSTIAGFGRDGSFLARQLTMGWNEGTLNHPSQMCINDKDQAFIADRDNSRIQVFQITR